MNEQSMLEIMLWTLEHKPESCFFSPAEIIGFAAKHRLKLDEDRLNRAILEVMFWHLEYNPGRLEPYPFVIQKFCAATGLPFDAERYQRAIFSRRSSVAHDLWWGVVVPMLQTIKD